MNILLFLLFIIQNSIAKSNINSFHVCGSYCGPGWCNNMWLPEGKCNATILPEYHIGTGYSCADLCCQKHDICCGRNIDNRKNCNKEIVSCLNGCNPLSLTCTYYKIPFPAGVIDDAMYIVEDWCCGKPCKNKNKN